MAEEEVISQNIFTINNFKVVHGVSWFPIITDEGGDEEKDILNLVTQHKSGLMVRLEGIKDISFPIAGLVSKKSAKNFPNPKKEDIYALGALFSELCRNGIFNKNSIFLLNINDFEEINIEENQGKLLSVVVENGQPLSGSELFLEKDEIFSNLKNNWLTKNINFSIYTYDIDSNELLFIPNNFEITKLDLNYLQHLKTEDLFRCKLYVVKGDTRQQKKAAAAAIAIMAFIGYLYWEDVYNYFFPPPPPPLSSIDYVKKYKEGINQLLNKDIVFGNQKLNEFKNIINLIPVNVNGWKLSKLECKKDNCSIFYGAIKDMPTNYYVFQQEINNYNLNNIFNNIKYKFDGKSIELKISTKNKNNKQNNKNSKNNNSYENIIPIKQFEVSIIPVYQDLKQLNGFNFTFQKLNDVRVTGVSLKDLKTEVIKKGKFVLSGNGWLLEEIPIGNNMSIENFKLTMQRNNTSNLIIQGTYYVKE